MTRTERGAVLAVAVVAAAALLLRLHLPPYDDAFFFLRFARNLVDHGVFAWNPAEGPVHGLTSQLFGLATVLVHLVAGPYTVLASRLLLAASLPLAAWLLLRAGGRPVPVTLALCSPVALATIASGLETATVLAFGALWLAAVERQQRAPDAVVGALLVGGYLLRPDTVLLTAPVLVLDRRWRALVVAGAGLALTLGVLHIVYGSALPLSFGVKSGLADLTGPDFLARCRQAKLRHALYFALVAWPLLVAALNGGRRILRILLPAALFVGYHLFLTVDIMGLHARFFAPALPWLALAASDHRSRRALVAVVGGLAVVLVFAVGLDALPPDQGWAIGRVSPWSTAAWVVAVLVAAAPGPAWPGGRLSLVASAGLLGIALGDGRLPDRVPDDDGYAAALSGEVTSWRGAERLRRCVGEDLSLFHSEIGVLGVMFPDARITDLGGLMTPAAQLDDLSALCDARAPDAIFLPHRNYRRLNARLAQSGCILGYTQVTEGGSSPLWLRDDHLAAWDCDRSGRP